MVFIMQGIERVRKAKHPVTRRVLPGNVDMITGSAFLPAHPVKAGQARQGHPADLPVIP
jgi:hypothetical protein